MKKININIKELQKSINTIFEHVIDDLGAEEISLDESYYWCIDKEKVYNPFRDPEPRDMSLGDLVDDLSWLMPLGQKGNDALPATCHFIFASSILRYLGESDKWYEVTDDEREAKPQ